MNTAARAFQFLDEFFQDQPQTAGSLIGVWADMLEESHIQWLIGNNFLLPDIMAYSTHPNGRDLAFFRLGHKARRAQITRQRAA